MRNQKKKLKQKFIKEILLHQTQRRTVKRSVLFYRKGSRHS